MDRTVQSREALRISMFGELEIEHGGGRHGPKDLGGSRPKQVLEILLAARGRRVTTERLADLLWGPEPPGNAAASIQTFVSVLRRSLACDRDLARALVVTEPGAYRIPAERVELDLDRFDALVDQAARAPRWVARRTLETALGLVAGDVLEDEPYADWADEIRRDYRARVLDAHLDAAREALAERDVAGALAHADAATAIDPLNERAVHTAMLGLYTLGRQREALTCYRSFSRALAAELGLSPGADIRALEAGILRQEDAQTLLPRPAAGTRTVSRQEVPLLGRGVHMERLEAAVRRGIESGFMFIQLEGESGMGRTRLLEELAHDMGGVRLGCAACSPLEQHLPYVPLASALRQAGISPEDRRATALGAILPELAGGRGSGCYDEIDTLEELVQALASARPVVLLLDDLQFADPATVGALSYIQRRSEGLLGATVVTVRTEQAPDYHAVRALRPDVLVRLGPLSREDLEVAEVPGLYEATAGNPRFVADALLHDNGSSPSRGLAETVLAQCWQEGPRAYRILSAAALLEQPFEPYEIEAMLRLEIHSIAERLELLCQRRILRPDGFGFRFEYDLVRQILRASGSPARLRLVTGGEPPTAQVSNP